MTKKDQKVVEQETAKEDIDTLKEDTVVEVKESKVRKAITYGLIGLATIASVVMGVFGIRVNERCSIVKVRER